jgi:hypothetical protein
MSCRDRCRYEAAGVRKEMYRRGYKHCSVCEKAIKTTEDVRCYCCGHVLRTGAHNNDSRNRRIENVVRM